MGKSKCAAAADLELPDTARKCGLGVTQTAAKVRFVFNSGVHLGVPVPATPITGVAATKN
jgi:hypothetical protein